MNIFNKLKKLKTLLVDDDEFIRDALKIVFTAKGCMIRVEGSAEDGLEAIKKEQFDIIISDFRLPGMNGLDFIKLATASQPAAIQFLITAYRDDHIKSEATRIGVTDFIEKPFSGKKLIDYLDLAVKRQPNKPLTAGRL
ncbi:MAG: response regulator [Deltaproteobacteria bacterium]|nr:response regulator [Deltaproteobacteria bacterium]